AELAVLIDCLVSVAGELLQTLHQICGVEAGARQREMLASASIKRGHALAVHGKALLSVTPSAHLREQLLQLLPVALGQLLELNRSHGQRRPRNHCATPRTRRVTSGPEPPASPATAAARAASSSRRSTVRRGARAARAMTAAWSWRATGIAGACGSTCGSCTLRASRAS